MHPELILLVGWGIACLYVLWLVVTVELVRLHRARARIGMDLVRGVTRASEVAWLIQNRDQIAEWQEISEKSLDEGTATVRAIHHAIAAIPFTILESIPVTRDTTRVVHGVHDVASNGIYAGISLANRALGKQLRNKLSAEESATRSAAKSGQQPAENGSQDSQESQENQADNSGESDINS